MKQLMTIALCTALLSPAPAQDTSGSSQPRLQPVPMKSGSVSVLPSNSRINFVGTHEGPKPDPRKGGFSKFTGNADFAADGSLTGISFTIDTRSLQTGIPKLTAHLKSPDFFDVRQHPEAVFRSVSIAPADEPGGFDVTGRFTLLGTTKTVKIPVMVTTEAAGATLVSRFSFDRTLFGMTYGEGKVSSKVDVTVLVGKPTSTARQ